MASVPDATATATEDDRSTIQSLTPLLTVLGPSTVTVGILYYFGWARTRALFAYFGIDANSLDFSTADYVLRSAEIMWPALVAIAGVLLLGTAAHAEAVRFVRARRARTVRAIFVACLVAGAALLLLAVTDLLQLHLGYRFLAPVEIALALALFNYVRYLPRRHRAASREPSLDASSRSRSARTNMLVVMLIALTTFWAVALFADQSGQGRAEHLEASHFAETPDVVLYTRTRLHVDARDVAETDLGKGYEPYRFRYAGFKLLARTAGASVFVPYSWSVDNAYALILRTDDDYLITFDPHF